MHFFKRKKPLDKALQDLASFQREYRNNEVMLQAALKNLDKGVDIDKNQQTITSLNDKMKQDLIKIEKQINQLPDNVAKTNAKKTLDQFVAGIKKSNAMVAEAIDTNMVNRTMTPLVPTHKPGKKPGR